MGRALGRLNFNFKSQKGSHMKFERKETGYPREVITIPNHRVLRKGTLNNILKKLKIDIQKLKELL